MPIKHAIWKVAKSPEPLKEIALASEQQLEDNQADLRVKIVALLEPG